MLSLRLVMGEAKAAGLFTAIRDKDVVIFDFQLTICSEDNSTILPETTLMYILLITLYTPSIAVSSLTKTEQPMSGREPFA
jgi:hypothetical protein